MKNKRIRTAMLNAGINQSDLAKILGISDAEISYALKYELSKSEQDRIIERIKEWVSMRDSA